MKKPVAELTLQQIAERQLRIRQLQAEARPRGYENRFSLAQIFLIVLGAGACCFIAGMVVAKLFW